VLKGGILNKNIVFGQILAIITQNRDERLKNSKQMSNSKKYLESTIPVKFTINGENVIYPTGHVNNVKYWGNISRENLHSLNSDGTPKLLTMDVDFGDVCSLKCPECFRRDDKVDIITKENQLSEKEIIEYIKQAKTLGLQSVKILGRGEPFQNPNFLGFLQAMTDLDIGVGIFTKGMVLGWDKWAKNIIHNMG
jgi:hypothetical protein